MDDKQLERKDKSLSFMGFMDMVHALLQSVGLNGDGWEESFVMTNPTTTDSKSVNLPIITWSLREKVPGQVTKEHREIKPRHRFHEPKLDEEANPVLDKDGQPQVVSVYGRISDVTVDFTVFAQNNQEAMKVTQEFTDMMDIYKGFFMKEGLLNYWFVSEVEGQADHKKDEMVSRIITYHVRVQEVFRKDYSLMKEVILNVKTAKEYLASKNKLPSQFGQ